MSRLTLDALAVCARVRRVAGIDFFDTVTLVVFSTAGAFLGLSLRVDAAWVIVTGVRYVTVCRASSRPANHAKKAPAAITTVTLDRKSG